MAKISTLVDLFPGSTLDGTKWGSDGTVSVASAKVNVGGAGATNDIRSLVTYDATASAFIVQLVQVASVGTPTPQTNVVLDSGTAGTSLRFTVNDIAGKLGFAFYTGFEDASAGYTSTAITYNAAVHKWLKISESGGTVTMSWSTDGISWTVGRTFTTPAWYNAVKVFLSVDNASTTSAQYANVNNAPSGSTVPGAPTAAAATAGDTTATVSWTAPASNGGATITDYEVTASPAPATGAANRLVGSAATSYVFTGLTDGTAYTFTVKAKNSNGLSSASGASTAVTPAAAAVGTPQLSSTLIDLFDNTTGLPNPAVWRDIDPQNPSTIVSGRVVVPDVAGAISGLQTIAQWNLDSFSASVIPGTNPGDTTFVAMQSLVPGTEYRLTFFGFNVIASDLVNYADNTPAVSIGVQPLSGGATKYAVRFRLSGSAVIAEYSPDGGVTFIAVRSFAVPTWVSSCTFEMGAFNSPTGTTPVPTATAPSVPTSVVGSAGDATATITWSPPASQGSGPITGYRVTRNGNDITQTNGAGYSTDLAATARTFPFTGLINNTSYVLTVAAINGSGVGPAAQVTENPSSGVTGGGTVPPNPGAATVTLTSDMTSVAATITPNHIGFVSTTFETDSLTNPTEQAWEQNLDARQVRIPVKWNGSAIVSSAGGGNQSLNILQLVQQYLGWGWQVELTIGGRTDDFLGYVNGDALAIKNKLVGAGVDMTKITFTGPNEPNNNSAWGIPNGNSAPLIARYNQIFSELGIKLLGPVWNSYNLTEINAWMDALGTSKVGGVSYHHYGTGSNPDSVATVLADAATNAYATEVAAVLAAMASRGDGSYLTLDEINYSWQYVTGGHTFTEMFQAPNVVWHASVIGTILKAGARLMHYGNQNGPLGLLCEANNTNPDGRPPNTPFPAYWGVAAFTGYKTFSHFKDKVYASTSSKGLVQIYGLNNEAAGYNLVLVNKQPATDEIAQINLTGGQQAGTFTMYQTVASKPYDPPVKTGPFSYTGGSIKVAMPAYTVTTLVLAA